MPLPRAQLPGTPVQPPSEYRRLIHDPDLLIGFKLLATFVAVGIVLVMRRFRRMQLASWWMCLICTVLAVRWLTFNSMFV